MSKLTIVIPVYNDEKCIVKLLTEIQKNKFDHDVNLIIIDDCSSTPLYLTLQKTNLTKFNLVLCFRLPCNMGHQFAIAKGLNRSLDLGSDFTVVMDSDGEDMPKFILPLLDLSSKTNQITVAKRGKRYESTKFKMFYFFYRMIFSLLTGNKLNFGNFSVLPLEQLKSICACSTTSVHFPATILKSKLNFNYIKVDRGKRYFGYTKMNLPALVYHGLKSLSVFSSSVISRMLIASSSFLLVLFIAIFSILTLKFTGNASPGWASGLVTALFIVCFQICSLSFISILSIPFFNNDKADNSEIGISLKQVKSTTSLMP